MEEDARLWIGSSTVNGLSAVFTDLATGRVTIMRNGIEAFEDANEWYVVEPDFFIIGHAYKVELTVGVTPVQFYPYLFSAGTYTADTTLVDGVTFVVVKMWEPGGETYYTGADQYVSIP